MEQSIGIEKKGLPQTSNMTSKALQVGLWVLKLGLAGMFLMAGSSKLSGGEQMVGLFEAIGIGQWFRYFTGLIEVAGGLLVLFPSVAGFGALALAGTMVGAIATHLLIVGGSFAMPAGLFIVTLVVASAHRSQLLAVVNKLRQ
ncbi:MAG: DoxX family protein [Bdellovibrionales bacterium]|nr:DoxX family protein [Bdellovibrionales bacterium]